MSRRLSARAVACLFLSLSAAVAWAIPASAAGRSVQLANGVSMTVSAGWSVQKNGANTATVTHASPPAEFSLLATGKVGATVNQALQVHITQYAQGFGLKHLHYSSPEQVSTGAANFDQASQTDFSGTHNGQKLIGAAVEYQNSETGNGAFAAVIGTAAAKRQLKKSANAMFNSVFSAG
jgi:hypothetical protein